MNSASDRATELKIEARSPKERKLCAALENVAYWDRGIRYRWYDGTDVLMDNAVLEKLIELAAHAPAGAIREFAEWCRD